MSAAEIHEPEPQPVRHRFTADQYERMAEVGVLRPEDHVELIEGEIIRMAPMGDPHALCVSRLLNRLPRLLPDSVHLRVQCPVRLSDTTEPEPDLVVVGMPVEECLRHPRPEDIRLVIEVAGSSLPFDRRLKLPLYARAGIPEVWIVNLGAGRIEIGRRPEAGRFALSTVVDREGTVRCESVPEIVLAAADILGRA